MFLVTVTPFIILLFLSQPYVPLESPEDQDVDWSLTEGVVLCTVLLQHCLSLSRVSGRQTEPHLPLGTGRGAEDGGERP